MKLEWIFSPAPISLSAETVLTLPFGSVSNSLLTGWIGSLFLIGVALRIGYCIHRKKSSRILAAAEFVVETLLNLLEEIFANKRAARYFLPLLGSLLVFIIFQNLLGLLPGVGTIGLIGEHHGHAALIPFFRAASADLNLTLALGLFSVIATHYFGISHLGLKAHLHKFFNFKNPLLFFVGILESISEFAKVLSFSFRLFGNVFAGEVLLAVIGSLIPFIAAVPFYFMEIFVGLIQGLVFMMITVVFIKIHISHH